MRCCNADFLDMDVLRLSLRWGAFANQGHSYNNITSDGYLVRRIGELHRGMLKTR
jgi:hypothetical protein